MNPQSNLYFFVYEGRLKSSYDDVLSAVDNFLDQWDPSTAILIGVDCKEDYVEK